MVNDLVGANEAGDELAGNLVTHMEQTSRRVQKAMLLRVKLVGPLDGIASLLPELLSPVDELLGRFVVIIHCKVETVVYH